MYERHNLWKNKEIFNDLQIKNNNCLIVAYTSSTIITNNCFLPHILFILIKINLFYPLINSIKVIRSPTEIRLIGFDFLVLSLIITLTDDNKFL